MKIALTALVTAVACFATTATTGFASHRTSSSYITVHIGEFVYFKGLDVACSTSKADPDHQDRGPIAYCARASEIKNKTHTASVGMSLYHFRLGRSHSNYWDYTVARNP
jgi:hypothetical protein